MKTKVVLLLSGLQVLYALEGVGVVVFTEFWPALFTERRAVARRLGIHPLTGKSGMYAMLLWHCRHEVC